MKKMFGLMLLSGALLAMPSASSLYAGGVDDILAAVIGGESYDNENGARDKIKDCDDPLYDGSGSESSNGDGDGICDYPEA